MKKKKNKVSKVANVAIAMREHAGKLVAALCAMRHVVLRPVVVYGFPILLRHHFFFFSSRRRHTRSLRDWSSDVCSSDLSNRNALQDDARPSVKATRFE